MVQIYALSSMNTLGESPGLVVMGGDSHSEGRGCRIPVPYTGWTFFHINLLKICIDVCLKRPKLNEKRPGWPIFLKKSINTSNCFKWCVKFLPFYRAGIYDKKVLWHCFTLEDTQSKVQVVEKPKQ